MAFIVYLRRRNCGEAETLSLSITLPHHCTARDFNVSRKWALPRIFDENRKRSHSVTIAVIAGHALSEFTWREASDALQGNSMADIHPPIFHSWCYRPGIA